MRSDKNPVNLNLFLTSDAFYSIILYPNFYPINLTAVVFPMPGGPEIKQARDLLSLPNVRFPSYLAFFDNLVEIFL